ncbi:peptidase [Novipirellula sp. SH528]|uniref:peptidase n=1 Tax=Novipirellula sp. SH528 TaxID=3454466 RepID=UPI003F9FB4DB
MKLFKRFSPAWWDVQLKSNSASAAHVSLIIFAMVVVSPQAIAQRRGPDPHIAYAFPAGCQQGTTCEIVIGGQYLKEAFTAHLAGEGVKVEYVGWYRPMTRGEYNNLRMAMQQAKETLIADAMARGETVEPSFDEVALAAGITLEKQREMLIFRERDSDPKRQPNDQLQEELTLRLTVDPNAEPGKRELRLLTENSISNPIWLHIGRWPEVHETEPNDHAPNTPISRFPSVINGQILPGDIDRFSFSAKQGMKLVIEAAARDVIPYLADAVPGWFQATMTLTDSSGKEITFADSFHYRQDPVIYFEVPRDDTYTLSIHDALFRGREDFVYRITIGEIPFVTSVFPLGAQVESDVTIELKGWNLTETRLNLTTMSRRKHRPVAWYSLPQSSADEIRFPLQIGLFPEVMDEEPNNTSAEAQTITTRMTVNGRIDYPGDEDVYRIKGTGRIVVEVDARRRGSPLDSMLIITDADGKELAFNDDYEDKTQGLETHHADSHLSVGIPGSSTYFLRIMDAQQQGGRDFAYRLHVRAAQPDFELRVIPSSIIARPGEVVPITAFALRQDGFKEDIRMALVDPPPGFALQGATIPGTQEKVRMTLTVPATAPKQPVVLEMQGSNPRQYTTRNQMVRPAVPAEQMMQAFIWYHLVPVENWNVIVSGRPAAKTPFQLVMVADRFKLPLAGETYLNVTALPKGLKADELHVELHEPPPGISAAVVTNASGIMAIQLTTDAEKVQRGFRDNLLMRVYREWTSEPTDSQPEPKVNRTDYGYLPAIPIEVTRSRTR